MTTVACDGKTMAADSKTDMDGISDTVKKLHKARNGDILGFAGDVGAGLKFFHWYDSNRVDSVDLGDTCVLVLHPSGKMTLWDSSMHPMTVTRPVFAIGSGGLAALAAMLAGADAKKAVQISCKLDPASGPPVRTLTLEG